MTTPEENTVAQPSAAPREPTLSGAPPRTASVSPPGTQPVAAQAHASQASTSPRTASISHPTRREMKDWIVAYVRERSVPEKGSVSWEDLLALVGSHREDTDFLFAVSYAIEELYEATPSLLFRREASLGLVRLSEDERCAWAQTRRSEGTKKIARALVVVNTTDVAKLTDIQRAELDRERLRLIHLARENERVKSRKWLTESAPSDPNMLE